MILTVEEVSEILGHSSLSMLFRHYGRHLGKSHLKISRSIDIFDDLGYSEENETDKNSEWCSVLDLNQ